jgi:23S rRNA (adenine2503-C2)-methyltransferase
MKVIGKAGRNDIAWVYVAEVPTGERIEFVESVEPHIPRLKKWVNIVSTLFGCPVKCTFCDAGLAYSGALTDEQILEQIDFMVRLRFGGRTVPVEKWKVQFARMGEPALNPSVLDVLAELPQRYDAPGLLPCISTTAPVSCETFFDGLEQIKHRLYPDRFQLQFSLHTTDERIRSKLVPIRTLDMNQMATYGRRFFDAGGRKITLNFAAMEGVPVEAKKLADIFDPTIFLVKITPLNPTAQASRHGNRSLYHSRSEVDRLLKDLAEAGFQAIESVGEPEENAIGSNCGQYVSALAAGCSAPADSYTYELKKGSELYS